MDSTEGGLLLTGILIALVSAGGIGLLSFHDPDTGGAVVGMTASHIMFGRAAGMSFGYTLGMGHGPVIVINALVETVLVLLFYPLFVLSWRHMVFLSILQKTMARTREAAERHQNKIRRYGIIGLFVFVWLPFWMTGPLVGCIIGFFLGLRTWLNLTVVLLGTYVAIGGYAFLLKGLYTSVEKFGPYAPLFLLAAIIGILAIAHWFAGRRKPQS